MTKRTDKELLELAAKAAGYEPKRYSQDNSLVVINGCTDNCRFNPLNDDGDALRLAVKLDIPISPESCNGTVWVCKGDIQVFEPLGSDPYAATRRAIVRAAAEIGAKL